MATNISEREDGGWAMPKWWGWEELEIFRENGGGRNGLSAVIKFEEEKIHGKF